MRERGVQLQYRFAPKDQRGGDLNNPLFDLLTALRDGGSIQHAARQLGASYRYVWGQFKHWEEVLGEALISWNQGQSARLTPFAERLLWSEQQARARMTPHIEALRAELEHVLAEAMDGRIPVLPLWASHDLALPLLRDQATRTGPLHINIKFAGSMDALRSLAEGRCLVAGFHLPSLAAGPHLFSKQLKPLLKPGRHKLMAAWRRTQGMVVPAGNPLRIQGLADALRPEVRFVARQAGSGTRLLTEYLMAAEGLVLGPTQNLDERLEDSHLAVAAAVASGRADAGLAVAAAAHQFKLDFVPLVEEDYFLVCLQESLAHDGVRALQACLSSTEWSRTVQQLQGYHAMPNSGQVLSLTKALPWWRFKAKKKAPGPA
jgi:putative molybdopterin biosynthesis protein